MAKKKNNNGNVNKNVENENTDKENKNDNENKSEGEKTKNKKEGGGGAGGDGQKKKKKDDNGSITMVFKVDMHCEGCASKIVKCIRCFQGVESVKTEMDSNKVTVVGTVDPTKIRDRLLQKTKKKVDLISPQPPPKKDKDPKQENNKSNQKNSDEKKPKEKEPPVTTVVLKLALHCQGCIEKIQKIVSKTKGFKEMSVDKQKDTVTVKGTMDVKALIEYLKERMKRPVEIVPSKKEKEDKDSSNGGGDNNTNGGGKKKKKGGGGNGDGGGDGAVEAEAEVLVGSGGGMPKIEGNRMEYMNMMMMQPGPCYGYGYPQPPPGYEYGYPVVPLHAPQMFSDENPNACSVM